MTCPGTAPGKQLWSVSKHGEPLKGDQVSQLKTLNACLRVDRHTDRKLPKSVNMSSHICFERTSCNCFNWNILICFDCCDHRGDRDFKFRRLLRRFFWVPGESTAIHPQPGRHGPSHVSCPSTRCTLINYYKIKRVMFQLGEEKKRFWNKKLQSTLKFCVIN